MKSKSPIISGMSKSKLDSSRPVTPKTSRTPQANKSTTIQTQKIPSKAILDPNKTNSILKPKIEPQKLYNQKKRANLQAPIKPFSNTSRNFQTNPSLVAKNPTEIDRKIVMMSLNPQQFLDAKRNSEKFISGEENSQIFANGEKKIKQLFSQPNSASMIREFQRSSEVDKEVICDEKDNNTSLGFESRTHLSNRKSNPDKRETLQNEAKSLEAKKPQKENSEETDSLNGVRQIKNARSDFNVLKTEIVSHNNFIPPDISEKYSEFEGTLEHKDKSGSDEQNDDQDGFFEDVNKIRRISAIRPKNGLKVDLSNVLDQVPFEQLLVSQNLAREKIEMQKIIEDNEEIFGESENLQTSKNSKETFKSSFNQKQETYEISEKMKSKINQTRKIGNDVKTELDFQNTLSFSIKNQLSQISFRNLIDQKFNNSSVDVKTFVRSRIEAFIEDILRNFDFLNGIPEDESSVLLAKYTSKNFHANFRNRPQNLNTSQDSSFAQNTSHSRLNLTRNNGHRNSSAKPVGQSKRNTILERTGNILELMNDPNPNLSKLLEISEEEKKLKFEGNENRFSKDVSEKVNNVLNNFILEEEIKGRDFQDFGTEKKLTSLIIFTQKINQKNKNQHISQNCFKFGQTKLICDFKAKNKPRQISEPVKIFVNIFKEFSEKTKTRFFELKDFDVIFQQEKTNINSPLTSEILDRTGQQRTYFFSQTGLSSNSAKMFHTKNIKAERQLATPDKDEFLPVSRNDRFRSSNNIDHSVSPSKKNIGQFEAASPLGILASLCRKIIIYESKLEQLKESLFANNTRSVFGIIDNFGFKQNRILQFISFKKFIKVLGFQMNEKSLLQLTNFVKQVYKKQENGKNEHEIVFSEFVKFILPRKQVEQCELEIARTVFDLKGNQFIDETELRILKSIFLVFLKKLDDISRIVKSVEWSKVQLIFDAAKSEDSLISKDKIVGILGQFGMPVQSDHVFFVLRDFGVFDGFNLNENDFKAFFKMSAWQ